MEQNKTKRPGTQRPYFVQAQIFMARCSHLTEEDEGNGCLGYWYGLLYYGPVSYDSLMQLKRHISPMAFQKILEIMLKDDLEN